MLRLLILSFFLIVTSCAVQKKIKIKSNQIGSKVSKGGATICSSTPCNIYVEAGDNFFCTPSYWSFELEVRSPTGELINKKINPCSLGDSSSVDFDFKNPISEKNENEITINATSYGVELKQQTKLVLFPSKESTISKSILNNLVDRLQLQLLGIGHLQIIERQRVNVIFNELGIQNSGATKSKKELGELAGADYVGFVNFDVVGTNIIGSIKLIDVETGNLVRGISSECLNCNIESVSNKFIVENARKF